jgi:hypothetical protein
MDANEFLTGLRADLQKALTPAGDAPPDLGSQIADLKKSVDALTARVAAHDAALTPGDGAAVEAGPVTKAITDLSRDVPILTESIEKALDRIARLEKLTVTRKSLAGQDSDDDAARVAKTAESGGKFGGVMAQLLNHGVARLT